VPALDGLVGALRERGAEHWTLCASAKRQLRIGVKDREVGNPHSPIRVTDAGGVSYRVVWRSGAVSRGHLERRQVDTDPDGSAEQALTAAHDDPDAAWIPPAVSAPEVPLYDERAAAAASGDTSGMVERLAALRRRAAEDAFRTWSASFGASRSAVALRSSTGLDHRHEETSVGWHLSVDGETGGGHGARTPDSDDAFHERVDRVARNARALRDAPATLAAGKRAVLLHPAVVESWILAHLLWNLGGSAVADGEGHFGADDFGSGVPVLREDLDLRVDPLLPLRLGSYRYTPEGVPAERSVFVERGRLVSPILGVKYARRLGRAPTGLAHDSDTLLFSGAAPLELEAATAAADALVLSVLGVHTQDAASGDFSLSASQCLATGGAGGRLRLTLSGNLFDVLCSDSLRFVRFPLETTPGLRFVCHVDPRSS
jgi:PmbA protein